MRQGKRERERFMFWSGHVVVYLSLTLHAGLHPMMYLLECLAQQNVWSVWWQCPCVAVLSVSYMSRSDWTALRTVRALPKEHLRKPEPEQSWSVDAQCQKPAEFTMHFQSMEAVLWLQVATEYNDLRARCEPKIVCWHWIQFCTASLECLGHHEFARDFLYLGQMPAISLWHCGWKCPGSFLKIKMVQTMQKNIESSKLLPFVVNSIQLLQRASAFADLHRPALMGSVRKPQVFW